MKPSRLLDVATGAALSRLNQVHKQYFRLGAAGVRGEDGVLVVSYNGSPREPEWAHHAEARLCRKLTPKSVVAVARVLANGSWTMAKPCPSCQRCLRRVGVERVYYTISPGEYGVMLLEQ